MSDKQRKPMKPVKAWAIAEKASGRLVGGRLLAICRTRQLVGFRLWSDERWVRVEIREVPR